MANPGFPRCGGGGGGLTHLEVGAPTYYLAKFLPETVSIRKKLNLRWGGGVGVPHLGSANESHSLLNTNTGNQSYFR